MLGTHNNLIHSLTDDVGDHLWQREWGLGKLDCPQNWTNWKRWSGGVLLAAIFTIRKRYPTDYSTIWGRR